MHKAVKAMSTQTDMQRNKLMHLENTLAMYGIYNMEALEKLVKTVHALHSRETSAAQEFYSQMHSSHHYAIHSILYLRTIKDKYIETYNLFHNYTYMLRQLEFWPKVIYQFHS